MIIENFKYAFATKRGKTFTITIRDSFDLSKGDVLAMYFDKTKAQAKKIAKEQGAQPWNF